MNARLSSPLGLDEITAGLQASVPFVVRQEDMERFAELSGDFNPLHVDAEFARDKGFDDAVVYGALIVAKVSQLIGMHLPGRDALWTRVGLDFIRPLYVGQEAHVDGMVENVSTSTGMLAIKLVVRLATGELLAKGSAEVILVTH